MQKKSVLNILRLRIWLQISTYVLIVLSVLFCLSLYNPNVLKIFIRAGLPVDYLVNLPGALGSTFLAANAPQISVEEVKNLIDSNDKSLLLIDVRMTHEYEYSHISGAILVPLSDIETGTGIQKIRLMLPGHRIITYCGSNPRSNRAVYLLQKAGISATNMTDGIREWKRKIEPSMPIPY